MLFSPILRLVVSAIVVPIASFVPVFSLVAPAGDAQSEARRTQVVETFQKKVVPFLKTHCLQCHGNNNKRKGGIDFAKMIQRPGDGRFRSAWQVSLAQVREQSMPPEDAGKQPSEAERRMFVEWVGQIKYLSPEDPGPFVIRRLTKVEFGNTLHDLFGVDPTIVAELPEDVPGEGYLNTLSPSQSEQYLAIANAVLDRVLGPKEGPPTETQKKLFGETPQAGKARDAAKLVARTQARRAFRRPASDEELETLLRVFDLAQTNKLSYPDSLRLMLKAILVSPQFLFITPAKAVEAGKSIVPLDDYQLASRLSYFLWATMPDAELADLADKGTLHEPEVPESSEADAR
ncbi:MAG: DUF1595 domain-containing protein [Gemmataceae bacterium]